MKPNKLVKLAEQLVDIEFGDHGLFGANVAPHLLEEILRLKDQERFTLIEQYLVRIRVRMLDPTWPKEIIAFRKGIR